MKKLVYLLILIVLILMSYIIITGSIKDEYNNYSFIDSNRYNPFNFKFPKEWHVQMQNYWSGNEAEKYGLREASPTEGVYIYMNESDEYIEIIKTHSQSPFGDEMMSLNLNTRKYEIHKDVDVYKITNDNNMKALGCHKDDINDDNITNIYIAFESNIDEFNNRVGVRVRVSKDFYAKNKNKIWKTIKSIQINE